MRYELRMTAFDCMDQVHVHLSVTATNDDVLATRTLALTSTTTVQGEGESVPSLWARDALVAALESLP